MEMYFLIFIFVSGTFMMPEKYTKDECEAAAPKGYDYFCIKAPSAEYCKFKYMSRMQTTSGGSSYAITEKVCE